MQDKDRDYYRARLAEETVLTRAARTVEARAAHRRLAELYAAVLGPPVPPIYRPASGDSRAS